MTNFKIFLQSGKLMIGEFPDPPSLYFTHYSVGGKTAETAMMATKIYQEAVEAAKASAVDVVNGEVFPYSLDGHNLNDLPKGWTVEYEETCKWDGNRDACGNETCWDLQECQKSPGKKIARLIPSKASGIVAIGVPESGDFDAEPQWMVEENDIPAVHAQLDIILGKKSDSPVIPEGSEKDIILAASNVVHFASRIIHGFSAGRRHDHIQNELKDCQYHFKLLIDRMGADKPAIDDTLKDGNSDRYIPQTEVGLDYSKRHF